MRRAMSDARHDFCFYCGDVGGRGVAVAEFLSLIYTLLTFLSTSTGPYRPSDNFRHLMPILLL